LPRLGRARLVPILAIDRFGLIVFYDLKARVLSSLLLNDAPFHLIAKTKSWFRGDHHHDWTVASIRSQFTLPICDKSVRLFQKWLSNENAGKRFVR
jgi:hypothetical protein